MTVTNELDSTCGISDEELTQRFKESIRIDNEISGMACRKPLTMKKGKARLNQRHL